MAKPKNKKELLQQSNEAYDKLQKLLSSLSQEQLNSSFPKGTLNRNVRDVLTHLHHWHILSLGWYKVGMKGDKPKMPAEGYTWQTLPAMNKEVWKQCQDIELSKAKSELNKSFKKIQKIIEKHSDKELFEKKKYAWTGSTSLGAYLIMNTVSHYKWGIKLIKKNT